jgi:hypothetical protein
MSRRYVQQSPTGGWVVTKEGHRRPTAQGATKAQAVARARVLASRDGGGEVRVVDGAGKIVSRNTVAPKNGSRGTRSSSG